MVERESAASLLLLMSSLKSQETLLLRLCSPHIIQLIILVFPLKGIANHITFKYNFTEKNVNFFKVHYSRTEMFMRYYFRTS